MSEQFLLRREGGRPNRIQRIAVGGLFGRYNYEIATPEVGDPRMVLLYGENGVGKTTVLRVVFAMVSAERNRGYKSYLATVPFHVVSVEFDDGTEVTCMKRDGPTGSYVMRLRQAGRETSAVFEANRGNSVSASREVLEFMDALHQLEVCFFYLSDDRQLSTSGSYLPFMFGDRARRPDDPWRNEARGFAQQQRHGEVSKTLELVDRWLHFKASQFATKGDEQANQVFLNLLQAVVSRSAHQGHLHEVLQRFAALSRESREFEQLGIAADLREADIMRLLDTGIDTDTERNLTALLASYVDTVEGRFDGLRPFKRLVRHFSGTVNEFLTGKQLSFNLRQGIGIQDETGRDVHRYLSSGESNLVVLLCYALMARDERTVFLIDEPELSLNISWQRNLVGALLGLTEDTAGQFVMATHSMEILAQHRNCVVRIQPLAGYAE